MSFSRAIAVMMLVAPVTALAQAPAPTSKECLVLIDRIEALYQATNRGFGPANVRILHDLTADFLGEQGYHAGSELISIEPHPAYTHSLSVELVQNGATQRLELVLAPLGENGANAVGTKVPKPQRLLLGTATVAGKATKRKVAAAREELYQDAEDQYFRALKKLKKCE
jgi:hypothetical protein